MSDFLTKVDEIVVRNDTNVFRFERFCIAVVSAVEGGITVTPTSVSWDRGRDGVGLGRGSGIFVCASLRDDVDQKVIDDLERLIHTTHDLRKIYFCFRYPLSEHKRDQIREALDREVDGKVECVVLGCIQMCAVGREKEVIEKYYGAEISDILRRIENQSEEGELDGLRLALLSVGAEESVAIRNSVYEAAILDVLTDGAARSEEAIRNAISEGLKLGRSIDKAALSPYLNKLKSDGYLSRVSELYSITEAGRAAMAERELAGAESLARGRQAIRDALETAIGSALIDDEFNRIWRAFEDKMCDYFTSRGERLVTEISIFIDPESANDFGSDSPEFDFVKDFALSIASLSSHADRQTEISTAIKDLFSDKSTDAAQWLVKICASFVAACAMGLEYKTSQAIVSILKRTSLTLDTDVVLTLLGEAEPDHHAVDLVVQKWVKLGGKVLVAGPVLQEVAYHASIANRDYEQVRTLDLTDTRTNFFIIENAFVRSFAKLLIEKQARQGQWSKYLEQFKGKAEYDYSKVFGYLNATYKIESLPGVSVADSRIVEEVRRFIIQLIEAQQQQVDKNSRDKASRDAELYVSLTNHASALREADPDATCLLVSSSRVLSRVDKKFLRSGEERLVISIPAVLYLVSLLPNVSLGLSALKAFLFDGTKNRFSSDLERTVLRLIQASKQRSLPFAKRGLLMREVRSRLLLGASEADKRNHDFVESLEKRSLRDENRDHLVDILAKSLDAVDVETRSEGEARRLKRRVAELESQLEIVRSSRRKQ